jgi:C1A family cysteine protease
MEHTKESVSRGYHAVVIVGYELDLRGNLKTLKIQNSWGDKWGDEGILHMDRSFFWRHFETIAQIK